MPLDLAKRPKKQLLLAIPFVLLASLFSALMAACVKLGSSQMTAESMVFWRNLISLLILLPWLKWNAPRNKLKDKISTKELKLHIIRGVSSFLAVYLYFYSLQYLDLSSATLLFNTIPIFIPIVALVWQGFAIKHRLWWAIGIAFLGIALVLKPEGNIFQTASLLALLSGIIGAVSLVSLRLGHYTEPPARMLFYLFVICMASAGLFTLFSFKSSWLSISQDDLVMLVLIGVFGFLYQMFMTAATKYAPIRLLSPFLYMAVIFTMFLDQLIWRTELPRTALIGFVFIVLGAILMLVLYPKEDTQMHSK
jgi:drug/metabolite transporter (DMT)-like permease